MKKALKIMAKIAFTLIAIFGIMMIFATANARAYKVSDYLK